MGKTGKKGFGKRLLNILPDVTIITLFIVASIIYFAPALEGKIIFASDNLQASCARQQAAEYMEQTGESSWWMDSMFSGMPVYQVGGFKYLITRVLSPVFKVVRLGEHCAIFFLFFYLLAFYFLLRAFDVKKWMSMAGAFAMALSSYFLIVIAATHYGKPVSIVNMSLVLAGFVITYRGKYAWGGFVTAFFTMLGFFNHPQMSYYMCLLIGMCWLAELAIAITNSVKQSAREAWKNFALATVVFACSFGIGLATQATNFLSNREYQAETMRGGHSDLAADDETESGYKATNGLALDYATQYSYQKGETMTFLIPNYEGGASTYDVGDNSVLYEELLALHVPKKSASQFCKQAYTYHGDEQGTSGPVYMGAIICFLFILALILVKGPYKWALLVATIFSVLLSWGRHFMPLTEFFFQYFPMYSKFRAVESILIVAEITMPLLAFLGIKAIGDKERSWKFTQIAIGIAGGIIALICMIVALSAGSIDVASANDGMIQQYYGEEILQAILKQRTAMISTSAWRSFGFVLIGIILAYGYAYVTYNQKNNKGFLFKYTDICFGVLFTVFIVVDMWPVDKKFCNDSAFKTTKERDKYFAMQEWEKEILQDDGYFRVLNLTANVFNDARTSYYVNSVGGYSAAKLRRYQDIIDQHLTRENHFLEETRTSIYKDGYILPNEQKLEQTVVLNMLNTKYVVWPVKQASEQGMRDAGAIVVENPYAMGAAWLVDDILVAETPTEECKALREVDLHKTAVIGKDMIANLENFVPDTTSASIELVESDIAHKRYHVVTTATKVAVFSEIYYPKGWKVYLDNQEVTHFRANYLLRAMVIPEGEHEILFVCDPDSVRIGDIVSMICLVLMLGLLGWGICGSIKKCRSPKLPKKPKKEES